MKKCMILIAVMALGLLVSGCSTTTCSLMRDNSGQTQHVPQSVGKGKIVMEGMNFPRYDDPIFKAVQDEWDTLPATGAKYKADCKFKYEVKDTHQVVGALSAVLWFGTIFTFPMIIPRDLMCSAEIVIRDESGKIVKTIQTEKFHADVTTYMSGLPTSWIIHLVSSAPINKAGFVSLEFADATSEASKIMFKSSAINDINFAEGKLPK